MPTTKSKPKLNVKPLSEFRANVKHCLAEVKRLRQPIIVTRRGKAEAVVIDPHEYEELISLREAEQVRELVRRGRADIAAGRVYTLEEVMNHLEKIVKKHA